MRFLPVLLCLFVSIPDGSSAKTAEAVAICPITNHLLAALRDAKAVAKKPGTPNKLLGTTDGLFVSAAELNGYLDGDPKLTFDTGDQKLAPVIATCLKNFAQIGFVAAIPSLLISGDRFWSQDILDAA